MIKFLAWIIGMAVAISIGLYGARKSKAGKWAVGQKESFLIYFGLATFVYGILLWWLRELGYYPD